MVRKGYRRITTHTLAPGLADIDKFWLERMGYSAYVKRKLRRDVIQPKDRKLYAWDVFAKKRKQKKRKKRKKK